MIVIREDKCNKLSGLSSLFLEFNYNKDIISYIKLFCDTYYYYDKTKVWEIPVKNCYRLIDELSTIDDIEIFTMPEEEQVPIEHLDPNVFKTIPFPYQMEGIEYGLAHDKWLLLDEMGLGKTLQAIYLAQQLYERGKIEHCFIVCGVSSLRANWKKEIQKHSYLSAIILGEKVNSKGNTTYTSIPERAKQLQEKIDEFFIITNIESLRTPTMLKAFNTSVNNIGMIVVDEVHKIKDTGTKQGHNLVQLKAPYKLAMTGTLVVNEAIDCYAPLVFVEKQKNETLTKFKDYYCIKNGDIIVGTRNLDVLKEVLESCSLRRTKDILKDQLPDKTIIDEVLEMNEEQRKFYLEIEKGVVDQVDKVGIDTNNLLAMVTRLRQATSCPQVLTTNDIVSTKVERCQELVEDLVSQNEKVVIFTNYKDVVNDVQERLKDYKPIVITGDTSEGDTSKYVDQFQNDDDKKVLIATVQKLGTGHTLTASRYMIFIDCPWTSAHYTQACDRIHRVGAKRPVFIYNLICKNTIDEKVSETIDRKESLSQFIVDNQEVSGLNKLKEYVQNLK